MNSAKSCPPPPGFSANPDTAMWHRRNYLILFSLIVASTAILLVNAAKDGAADAAAREAPAETAVGAGADFPVAAAEVPEAETEASMNPGVSAAGPPVEGVEIDARESPEAVDTGKSAADGGTPADADFDPDSLGLIDLSEKRTEFREQLEVHRKEMELARSRKRDYERHLAALRDSLPPPGRRTVEQEALLMEVEELRGAAVHIERKSAGEMALYRENLDKIEAALRPGVEVGVADSLVFYEPVEPLYQEPEQSVEDELGDIFEIIADAGEKERKKIKKSFDDFLAEASDLKTENLERMKANRAALYERLDRDYERRLEAMRRAGLPTDGVDAPPGYDERNRHAAPGTPASPRSGPPRAIPAGRRCGFPPSSRRRPDRGNRREGSRSYSSGRSQAETPSAASSASSASV